MNLRISYLILFLIISFLLSSCQKENNGTEEEQQEAASRITAEANAEGEIIFDGIFDNTIGINNEVGMEGVGSLDRLNPCHTTTITRLSPPAAFPVRVTIDFGTNGCPGLDGHLRRGKVITEYSNRLLVAGATATTTFDGFFIDSIRVKGMLSIVNTSDANNGRQFTITITDGRLDRPSGNFTEWNSRRIVTQAEGLLTVSPGDDSFTIEGSANGRSRRGNLLAGWQSQITQALVKRFTCRWIVAGRNRVIRVNTDTNNPWTAVLDFGDGTCDNRAILTINGVSSQITLR